MEVVYYANTVVYYVLSMLVAAFTHNRDLLRSNTGMLMVYIHKFVATLDDILKELFDALAELAFAGGRMQWILDFIIFLCQMWDMISIDIISDLMCKEIFPIWLEIATWLT